MSRTRPVDPTWPDDADSLTMSVEFDPVSHRPTVVLTADPGRDNETRLIFSPLLAREVATGMLAAAEVADQLGAARAARQN